MARLVGVFASSHSPLFVRGWNDVKADDQENLARALAEGGQLLAGARGLAGALARHVSRAPSAETGLRLDPPLAIAVATSAMFRT